MVCAVFFVLTGTKYSSLRLTFFNAELQSLKKSTSISNTSTASHYKDCFWYSDNLYHLMCAILTDRPIQFHALTNRVPRMHRDLIRYLNVERCSSSFQSSNHRGAGSEDLERNLSQVQQNLRLLQDKCANKLPNDNQERKHCLHLARNLNRRLKNCTAPLHQCDTLVFDDSLSFCNLWNAVQDYRTIVSPHGFQLALPILAHAVLKESSTASADVHIVEIRWPGYGDRSYEEMTRIFNINHTLLFGMTPNGKLNTVHNECVQNKDCRKAERKRDLYCTEDTQRKLDQILSQPNAT